MSEEPRRNGSSAFWLPDDVNAEARARFRVLRLMRGRAQNDFRCVGMGVIGGMENSDFSTVTLGRLYRICEEMGETDFARVLQELFGDTHTRYSDEDAQMQRALLFLRRLNAPQRQVLLDMMQVWVKFMVDQGEIPAAPRNASVVAKSAGKGR